MTELSTEMTEMTEFAAPTEFERELRVRLAEALATADRAEATGEHDLAEAMRAHAADLQRTAALHAVPAPSEEITPAG